MPDVIDLGPPPVFLVAGGDGEIKKITSDFASACQLAKGLSGVVVRLPIWLDYRQVAS
jgi:hypothetical protein